VRRLAIVLALVVVSLAACGGGDEDDAASPPPPAAGTGAAGCTTAEAPTPTDPEPQTAPTAVLSTGTTYRVEVITNCGDFTVTLDPEASPKAVASFVALVENGYFDGTTFHRIVPGFVIQGGDPTATGGGGPGYQTVDTPAADTRYTVGTVAMAKGPADARGTAGSQFFVMTADAPTLPPDYAVIGRVTEGMETVLRIGTLGNAAEQPTQAVVVERMRVQEE
jgi:peptidyl-prolyl cis-trans isomerase B (cyclophilin B)